MVNTLATHLVGRQEPPTSMAITPTAPQTMPVVASLAAQRAQMVAELASWFVQGSSMSQLALDDGVMGWMGIPIIYIQKKKKKKSSTRNSRNAHLLEEEVAEEMSSGESIAGGDNNTLTMAADQSMEEPSGLLKDVEMT